MGEEKSGSGLHIDSDWKTEAAREKERLAAEERKAAAALESAEGPGFLDLINVLAMQAAVSLGGFTGPGGETLPPNPAAARHHIDLLEVLNQKTQGNLNEEERKVLETLLYELRMQFVKMVGVSPGDPVPQPPSAGQTK